MSAFLGHLVMLAVEYGGAAEGVGQSGQFGVAVHGGGEIGGVFGTDEVAGAPVVNDLGDSSDTRRDHRPDG